MLDMDRPWLPTQEECLRTSRELLRSVSRLVSQDNPSYTRSSRRDYGRQTGRLERTSGPLTECCTAGPGAVPNLGWGRTSSSRTPPQREAEAELGLG